MDLFFIHYLDCGDGRQHDSFDIIKTDQVVYLNYVRSLCFTMSSMLFFKKPGFVGLWESLAQSLN